MEFAKNLNITTIGGNVMLIEIKNRNGEIIITGEYGNVKDACEKSKTLRTLRDADLTGADLRDADLTGAYLTGADLRGAYLRGATLWGAYLRDADLRGATLWDAYLTGATLWGAYLRGADLRSADLRGADLTGADLRDADLRGADLRDAYLRGADLRGADLRGAEGITLPVITITGSIHSVFYMDGKIIIGCVEKTVDEWILDHEKTGKENNYTDAQIKEYKKYIDLIAMHEKDKT
jgi:uncharacterized protein YjbI with pentapeptide repeats